MRIANRIAAECRAAFTGARRFAAETRGNVAVIFALVLPLLIMITLGGVDINRASTVRMNLQDALDAATLAAARSQFTDDANITRIGLASLRANLSPFEEIELVEAQTTFHLNPETGAVEGDATVNVAALVANIVLPPYGQILDDYLPVRTESEVLRSNNRIEVALVIDNTGSMGEGGRLEATKAAAIDLINRLEAADGRSVEEDAIKISLVPFSMTVRVQQGGTNSPPSWMTNATTHTGGGDPAVNPYSMFSSATYGRFTLFQRLGTTWGGCVEARGQPHDIRDTAPSSGTQATMFVPFFAPDEPDRGDYPNHSTWQNWQYEGNNYRDDGRSGSTNSNPFNNPSSNTVATNRNNEWFARVRNVNKYVTTSGLNTSFGPNKGCDLQPIIRLTDDYAALRTAVSNMVASGNTNVPLGAMWGWHTLSPNAPFGDGQPYNAERLQKIIIIMTDGANVMSDTSSPNDSTYNGLGYIWQNRLGITSGNDSARRARMDNRMDNPIAGQEDLCGNMAAAGITIYTVAVQVDNQAQTLMRRCATSDEHFFRVDNAAGIGTAFDRIAGAIENLRISR